MQHSMCLRQLSSTRPSVPPTCKPPCIPLSACCVWSLKVLQCPCPNLRALQHVRRYEQLMNGSELVESTLKEVSQHRGPAARRRPQHTPTARRFLSASEFLVFLTCHRSFLSS